MLNWLKNIFSREQTSKKEKTLSAIIAFVYVAGLGLLGFSKPDAWFESLNKSTAQPPDILSAIVWLILFVLIAVSGYYVWNHYKTKFRRNLFVVLYAINGVLICLWSYLFFGQHNIINALFAMIGLIIVAEVMILVAFANKKSAAYFLIPYLIWVLYVTYLNATIFVLNS